ncbi:MAG: formyltetrahydrofolate deformylase [Planctomycetota bacterium]
MSTATLLIACPDRTGIVAALSHLLAEHGGNILDADQHAEPPSTDAELPPFFMRLAFDRSAMTLDDTGLRAALASLAHRYDMTWTLHDDTHKPAVVVFASKTPHCLYDLLVREAMGELAGDIKAVVANHDDLRHVADHFDKPFHLIPVTPDTKPDAESKQRELLEQYDAELVVLARYMQILSPEMSEHLAGRCINIHHSFLPAFVGAKPYHQAKARGVKIIGATAHYVTADLDQGPIIEQDVTRVTHRDDVDALVRKGRDLERQVLASAVRLHLQHRVLIHGNRTLVFR